MLLCNSKNYKIDMDNQPSKHDDPTSLDTLLREIQSIRKAQDELRECVIKLKGCEPKCQDER